MDGSKKVPRRRRHALTISAVVGLALVASGCSVAATWTQQSVEPTAPAQPDRITLSDVACPAPGACVAVGQQDSLLFEAFVLRQNGASWTRLPLPFPLQQVGEVSCRGVDDCVVGASPVDLHVTAGGLTVIPPGPGAGTFDRPIACVAAGCLLTYRTGTDSSTSWWDGSTWSPAATLPTGLLLDGRVLSCSSASSCLLIGNTPGGESLPLPGPVNSSVWNGSTWSAPVALDHETRVLDVACASPTDCFASAGVRDDSWTVFFPDLPPPELLLWNGTEWSTVPLDFPGAEPTEPPSVTCTSATRCTALWVAGKSNPASPTYLGRWDGTTWTVAATDAVATATSIACGAADSCVAVGGGTAQQLTGTMWTTTTGVPSGTSPSAYLDQLSCATASTCMATGDPDNQVGGPPGAWRLSGSSWVGEAAGTDDIDALSCGSATSCVTASGASGSITSRHWDGSAWTDLPAVSDPTVDRVDGISCAAGTWCLLMASGFGDPDSAWVWTGGTSWTKVATLVPRVAGATAAVSCSAPGSCVVVKQSGPPRLYQLAGSTWTELPTTGLDTDTLGFVDDIACTADGDCVAVGFKRVSVNADRVGLLAVRRNGTWTSTLRPLAPRFVGVDCTSGDDCVAVGSSAIVNRAAVERFDGTSWRPVAAPPGLSHADDISCGAPRTCEVLGDFVDGSNRAVVSKLHVEG